MSFIVLVSWGEGVKIRKASDCITQEHGDEGAINCFRTCKTRLLLVASAVVE